MTPFALSRWFSYPIKCTVRATSAPAEGPAYGLDLARHCEFPLRALQGHVYGSRTFGAA